MRITFGKINNIICKENGIKYYAISLRLKYKKREKMYKKFKITHALIY